MRQAIIDLLQALDLGTFRVSVERPWDASGQPLYLKNLKCLYVDEPDSTEQAVVSTLCGNVIVNNRESTILVFVTVDAKQTPANYDQVVSAVRGIRPTGTGVRTWQVDVTTSYQADALVTEFAFRYTELIVT